MKKPKRIRAVKAHIDQKGCVATTWEAVRDDTPYEPCYILRQSDIRALAEQMQKDYHNAWFDGAYDKKYPNARHTAMLHAMRCAGMTPGKGTQ